jgi:hypothetical protein
MGFDSGRETAIFLKLENPALSQKKDSDKDGAPECH